MDGDEENGESAMNSSEQAFFALPGAPPAPVLDADGWIEWRGGTCPVSAKAMVEVKCRNDTIETNDAQWFAWEHYDDGSDIIAYRVCEPAPPVTPPMSGPTDGGVK